MNLNGINTVSNTVAIREKIYNTVLRAQLEPYLQAQNYVDMVDGFTDGEKFIDIEIGNATVRDYQEGEDIVFEGLDMAAREFTINQYKQSGHYITAKFSQDSYISAQIASQVPAKEARAIAADLETNIFKLQRTLQRSADSNEVNGLPHRWVSGYSKTAGMTQHGALTVGDFSMASTALHKAGYFGPMVAFIPAYQEYAITQSPEFKALTSHQMLGERVLQDGAITGTRFAFNLFGFDVYVTNFNDLVESEVLNDLGATSVTAGKAAVAMFFANIPGSRPWRMAWRQMPQFEGNWNMYKQREEYVTVCRYGLGAGDKINCISVLCAEDPQSTFV